jgi:peptidoglycan/xylan/chitin deacetylase (PgdA/CDA1 family)
MKPLPPLGPPPNTLCMTMDVDCGVGDVTAVGGRQIGIEDLYIAPTFDRALPRYLDLAAEHQVPTTFFVVAGTVTKPEHRAMLRRMADAGHEIASHTLTHPKNLGHCDEDMLRRETVVAKRELEDIIGAEVVGFRAPGFFINDRVSMALREAGFRYSSSVNGAIAYNAVKLLFSLGRKLSRRPNAFYHVEPGALLAPTQPYVQHQSSFWRRAPDGDLVEIPTSTDALRMISGVTFSLDLMLPGWAWKAFLRSLLARSGFINIVLHDFEFLRAGDFPREAPLPLTTSLMVRMDQAKNSAHYCILAAAARGKRKVPLKTLVMPDGAGVLATALS